LLAAFSFSHIGESAPGKDLARFSTSRKLRKLQSVQGRDHVVRREKNESQLNVVAAQFTRCTKSGHRLVETLHLAAFKADTLSRFSLTLKIGRVKP
jgi:hypothetical protein